MSPVKTLLRHPAYLLLSIATLTLAVGANLVVFSFVNALWLKPRPISDPDRVVVIGRDFDRPDGSRYSELALESLRQSEAFEGVAGQVVTSGDFAGLSPRVTIPEIGHPVESLWITADYFSVLGVRIAGRAFEQRDGEAGGAAPAVISDRLWRTSLGGRPDIIGLRIAAHPVDLDIVGVAAAGFHGARLGEQADLWLPNHLLPRITGSDLNNLRFVIMPMVAIARLRTGVSIGNARAMVAQVRSNSPPPDVTLLDDVFGASDLPMVRVRGGDLMAMTAVTAAFVLVGGCATLMALTLVHYERRSRELAIRVALGASRSRLISQLTLELFGLAAIGTLAALFMSNWVVHLLPRVRLPGGADLGRLDLSIDWRIALVALVCCLAALALAAVVPIGRFTRSTLGLSLVAPIATTSRSSLTFRKMILGVHVGATTLVLVAAALFVESVTRAFTIGPGFDAEQVVFATVATRYRHVALDEETLKTRTARDIAAAYDAIDRIRSLPGVEGVALGKAPIGPDLEEHLNWQQTVEIDAGQQDTALGWLPVGDDYLGALGVPLLAGRSGLKDEAVIAPALAEDLWPGESPLGKRLTLSKIPMTVVGVADLAFGTLRRGPSRALLYFGDTDVPTLVKGSGFLSVVIRARMADPLVASVERLLSEAFPDGPFVSVTTGQRLVDADLGRERMTAYLFSGFGLVALMLAVVSVFGLVAYLVASRWREFAVRMALGASRANVAKLALWASLEPAIIGAGCGLIAALGLARTIESYLLGVNGVDAVTYVGVFGALILCAVGAGGVACSRLRDVSLVDSLKGD